MLGAPELLQALAETLVTGRWRDDSDGIRPWVERLSERPPVTVLIPVYDGIGHVRRLLGCPALWREASSVVLVDDCSSDPRVLPLLEQTAGAHPNAKLVRNARNLGFVRTVDIGLAARLSRSDVVVLNSDTALGPGWAAALAVSAYAYPRVATVSPLSNGAGFFSVPLHNRLNEVPVGWGPADCSTLLSWIAPALHERTPATCGFCWYVRGEALDTLGRLDQHMFHRGYAEETDFCLRAQEAGYLNLCQLTHYVEHAGGESFTTEKASLKRTNAKILGAMFPSFHERLLAYESSSVVPSLGAAFGSFAASGRDPHSVLGSSTALTFDVAPAHERAPGAGVLGIEPSEAGIRLVLEEGEVRLDRAASRTEELLAYLVMRLRPMRVVSQPGTLDPLVLGAAKAIGAEVSEELPRRSV